jgi:hypothetical protein
MDNIYKFMGTVAKIRQEGSKGTLKFLVYILLVCILATALLFSASVISKVVRAAETPPLVKDDGPLVQNRAPMKCGTYIFMEANLFNQGFIMLGSGIVNPEMDRWVLFQQVEGDDPLLWVILIYINKEYQGLAAGSACEIIVGRAWVRVE